MFVNGLCTHDGNGIWRSHTRNTETPIHASLNWRTQEPISSTDLHVLREDVERKP